MATLLVSEPGFAAETGALLDRIGPTSEITDYETLLAARAEAPDPDLSLRRDPAVQAADLYLPLRGGPVLVRPYSRSRPAGHGRSCCGCTAAVSSADPCPTSNTRAHAWRAWPG